MPVAARARRELVEFADGLDHIIVVEEKRSLIEVQVREELYGSPNQPVCVGKKDEDGNWLFPVTGALDPATSRSASPSGFCAMGRTTRIAASVAR